jgi:hypothetical protein
MRGIIDTWLANDLVERSDEVGGYALTERGFHWQNQLQIEVLGRREAAKGSKLIGSPADQLALLRNGSGIGSELLQQAGAGGESGRDMYKASLEMLAGAESS